MFALIATVLLGFVGLGTEVGSWYLARAQALDAADAAAIAGALAGASGTGSTAAALRVAAANGFVDGVGRVAVATHTPPESGKFMGDTTATEVVVSITFTPLIKTISSQDATVTARAVGRITPTMNACVLSLTGDLIVNVNQWCSGYFASNARDRAAITIGSGVTIEMFGMTTPGDCTNCPLFTGSNAVNGGWDDVGTSYLERLYSSYQPVTPNPYTYMDAVPGLPTPIDAKTFHLLDCGALGTMVPAIGDGYPPHAAQYPGSYPWPSGGNNGYYACSTDPNLQGNVALLPGTYFIYNTSLTIQAGANVFCVNAPVTIPDRAPCSSASVPDSNARSYSLAFDSLYGVTIVMIGPNAGALFIDPTATVNLSAAMINDLSIGYDANSSPGLAAPLPSIRPNPGFSALNGVLFYRDIAASPGSAGEPAVGIYDSTGASQFSGIMYFPSSYTSFAADIGTPPSCGVVVAYGLSLDYTDADMQGSPSNLSYLSANCGAFPVIQTATIVE